MFDSYSKMSNFVGCYKMDTEDMTIEQVIKLFVEKEETTCPLTERLVGAGYQQKDGGYIKKAKKQGMEIDYKRNLPSQYWHLMSYCYSRHPQEPFRKSIVCGELIFWMAEVLDCVPKDKMNSLIDMIEKDPLYIKKERPYYDRKKWNRTIQELCFNKIVEKVNELS